VMTDSLVEFPVDTLDKETNTECVFIPEKGARKRGSGEEPTRAIFIKRSQTFSPSAAVSKNQYICRVSCHCYTVHNSL
jgi:protein KIBRA